MEPRRLQQSPATQCCLGRLIRRSSSRRRERNQGPSLRWSPGDCSNLLLQRTAQGDRFVVPPRDDGKETKARHCDEAPATAAISCYSALHREIASSFLPARTGKKSKPVIAMEPRRLQQSPTMGTDQVRRLRPSSSRRRERDQNPSLRWSPGECSNLLLQRTVQGDRFVVPPREDGKEIKARHCDGAPATAAISCYSALHREIASSFLLARTGNRVKNQISDYPDSTFHHQSDYHQSPGDSPQRSADACAHRKACPAAGDHPQMDDFVRSEWARP